MEEDLDTATLLDESLWRIVEKKLMYINDPEIEFSKPIPASQTYIELNQLLEQMGKVRFSHNSDWKLQSKRAFENTLDLHRDVEIQLEEVTLLLEKFQVKAEENEIEQEVLASEVAKEAKQIELLESNLNKTTTEFESQVGYFEKLVKEAQRACEESKDLIIQGREKASLESTVTRLEAELAKAHLMLDDLQYKEKILTEKLNKARGEYDSNLKRLKSEYETLHKQHTALKSSYDELHTSHHSTFTSSSKELDSLKSEHLRLTKAYKAAIEELSTKEEVHESLKRTIVTLGEKADNYKSIIDANSSDWERQASKSEVSVSALQTELNKVKTAWMHDLETLSQVRLERDAMHTQYNLLDQKFNKISNENKALRTKVEDLKLEARANFDAAKVGVFPDKNIKTATGSITRIEIDYHREIESLKKSYEQELEKLNEELDWYKAKIETEKQWSNSLELANKHLNEQIEEMRQQVE